MSNDLPDHRLPLVRKHPAHGIFVTQNAPTIVYLTCCCDKRAKWLADDVVHSELVTIWSDASNWVVGRYTLMPDHLHLLAGRKENAVPLENWVKFFKSQFTKRMKNVAYRWQSGHWDTRIRTALHFEEKANYLYYNPVRAGLVDSPADWKYQGIIHDLRWD